MDQQALGSSCRASQPPLFSFIPSAGRSRPECLSTEGALQRPLPANTSGCEATLGNRSFWRLCGLPACCRDCWEGAWCPVSPVQSLHGFADTQGRHLNYK